MTRLIGRSVPAPRQASQPQDKRIFGDLRARVLNYRDELSIANIARDMQKSA
jgi:hypothetical protein